MRRAILLMGALALAACHQPNVVDDYPKETCENVDAAITHYPGVKPSDYIKNVERLACLYGTVEITARDTCSIAVDTPEYYHYPDRGIGNLKESTSGQLVASLDYGHRISQNITSWEIEHRSDPANGDRCLSAIHNIHPFYSALEDATRGLKLAGY
jgi:hypothetical protein